MFTALRDPRTLLSEAPMSRFQVVAVVIVGLLYTLDGFDVTALSFAAPALRAEWGINKMQLGYALSAGLFGMAIGSMLLSPLADVVSRRWVLLAALELTVVGTIGTALCNDNITLIGARVVTGLGIGAMLGVISPLAAEYANARRRDFAVSLTSVGYGIGAILGGLGSAWLLRSHGWRSIFYVASAIGGAMTVIVAIWLPEPLELLIARPGPNALACANAYLRRCKHPPIEALPLAPTHRALPLAMLFQPSMIKDTLVLTMLYFCYMIPLFYMQTWAPTLMVEIGLTASNAAEVVAAMSCGGVIAGGFIATTSLWFGLKRLQAILLGGAATMIALFIMIPADFPLLVVGAAITGFFLLGSMVGIWAIIARTFPTHLRASGTGFVLGIGRLGSTLSPILAGVLFSIGLGRIEVSLLVTVPALLASLAFLYVLKVRPSNVAATAVGGGYHQEWQ